MKICCITSNPQIDYVKNELEALGELEVHNKQKLSVDEVVKLARDADVLIAGTSGIDKISAELLDALPKLKFIALLTVGTAWVDLKHAKKKNILVSNIKGANSESVAEHTWGMILDLAKRVSEFDRDARLKGAFRFNDYKGKEVLGKTLGIVGLGDIGTKVARISKGFDMEVLGLNKSGKETPSVSLVDKETLLKKSNVIAICAPLTEETNDMISENEIAKMKDGVIVVNCAREEIINKKAILEGIKTGKVFGYGIETTIMTPVPDDDLYYSYPNIVVTPHNAFNTEDADKKSYELVAKNIKSWVDGKPQNIV